MRVHALNCPVFLGLTKNQVIAANRCLLLETQVGLVLVDSGLGAADVTDPRRVGLLRVILRGRDGMEGTALFQIRRLGFSAANVRHILMTHLDGDHTGGLSDFPQAQVHICRTELEAAQRRTTFRERIRYSSHHIDPVRNWVPYDRFASEPWFGFPCERKLLGLPEAIVLVRLPGHSRGHCGIALQINGGWLLHAGDAYYHRRQMENPPSCPPYFRLLQFFAHKYAATAAQTRRHLRRLATEQRGAVQLVCTHDLEEVEGRRPQ